MTIPTKEQQQLFIEWCGWEYRRSNPYHFKDNIEAQQRDMAWYHPNSKVGYVNLPTINLDFIFQYAIPKLFATIGEAKAIGILIGWVKSLSKRHSHGYWDLFWAIWGESLRGE